MNFNTCRICKKMGYESHKYPLIKYSVRHYVHADCALKKFGALFFDRLTPWQLSQFPALAAHETGLLAELELATRARPYVERYRPPATDEIQRPQHPVPDCEPGGDAKHHEGALERGQARQ